MRWSVAVVGLAVLAAGCSSAARRAPTSTTAAPTSSTSSASTTTTLAPGASTVPTTGSGVQNLAADAGVKAQLLTAYAAAKKLPARDFTGPNPGTTYYAFDGTTHTYWATAEFSAAPGVAESVLIGMQDGGNRGVFTRPPGGTWHTTYGGIPWPCPGNIPDRVLAVWHLSLAGSCIVASATSPARAAASPATALTMPPGTYFGSILFFDLQLDGNGFLDFEPETWQGSTPPVSHHHTYFSLQFGRSTTTEYWVGSSAASSHAVSGPFDTTFAGVVKNAMVPFASQPYSGYRITVTTPAGCQGVCGQAASISQIGPVTPTQANPDFTEPPGG